MTSFRSIVVALVAVAFVLAPATAVARDKDKDKTGPPRITLPIPLPPLPIPLPIVGKRPGTTGTGTQPGTAPAAQTTTGTTPSTTPATTTPPTAIAPPAPPQIGVSLALTPAAGSVAVKLPGGQGYVDLSAAGSVPTGSVIDARNGTLELKTAVDTTGGTQTVRLWGAVFEVRQSPSGRGMTEFRLRGGRPAGCPGAGGAVRARAAKAPAAKPAGLWAKDRNGRFRTRGRNSVATVRGTRWLTRETCAGTLTRVTEGTVAVRDVRHGRTVVVRAGHSYLARDRG